MLSFDLIDAQVRLSSNTSLRIRTVLSNYDLRLRITL